MKTIIIIASTLALGLFLISTSYAVDNSNSSKSDTSNQGILVGTRIGDKAPEISSKDPNGKIIKLSSLQGKVVLIDFWQAGVDHVEEKIQMLSQLITNIKTPNVWMLKVLLFIVLV